MKNEDLDRLQALCDAATPGPWYSHWLDDSACMNMHVVTPDPEEPLNETDLSNCVAACLVQSSTTVSVGGPDVSKWLWQENCEFIAEARTAIPALIEEVRRLQSQIEEMAANG